MTFMFKAAWYLVKNHQVAMSYALQWDMKAYDKTPVAKTVEAFETYGDPDATVIKTNPSVLKFFLIQQYESMSRKHGMCMWCGVCSTYTRSLQYRMLHFPLHTFGKV